MNDVPDVMRRTYAPISDEQKRDADELKRRMNELHAWMAELHLKYLERGSREFHISLTNLEQASMWAVKGITAT